jgi:hypothetical protein
MSMHLSNVCIPWITITRTHGIRAGVTYAPMLSLGSHKRRFDNLDRPLTRNGRARFVPETSLKIPDRISQPSPQNKGPAEDAGSWLRYAQERTAEYRRSGDQAPVTWILHEGQSMPANAIVGGEEHGRPLYICRAFHDVRAKFHLL